MTLPEIGLINLALFLLIGLVAGWLAATLMRGHGIGLFGNLVLGVLGAYIGPIVLRFFGLGFGGLVGDLLTATVGAVLLIALVGILKRL